jgi:hypothetical protein
VLIIFQPTVPRGLVCCHHFEWRIPFAAFVGWIVRSNQHPNLGTLV